MKEPNFLIIAIAVIFFYYYHFRKLFSHSSFLTIMFYTTVKGLFLLSVPLLAMFFAGKVLGLDSSSSEFKIISVTAFLVGFIILTYKEDLLTGVIDEIKRKYMK